MHDPVVPLTRLATAVAWAWTAFFVVNAWVAFAFHFDDLAALLGLTGCASSAVAATLNIRCYASRLARIIRAGGGPMVPGPRRMLHEVD